MLLRLQLQPKWRIRNWIKSLTKSRIKISLKKRTLRKSLRNLKQKMAFKNNQLFLLLHLRLKLPQVTQQCPTLQTTQISIIEIPSNKDSMVIRIFWKRLNKMVQRKLQNHGSSWKPQLFRREKLMAARPRHKSQRWLCLGNQRRLRFIPWRIQLKRRRLNANPQVKTHNFWWRKQRFQGMTQLKTLTNLTPLQRDLFKKSPKKLVGSKGKRPRKVQARKRRRHPSEYVT